MTAALPLVIAPLVAVRANASEPITVIERFRENNTQDVITSAGWQLQPRAELRTGYTDNVDWKSDRKTASPEASLRGSIVATRETGLATTELRGSHTTTVYAQGSTRSAHNTNIGIASTLRATKQLELRASLGYDIVREPGAGNGIEIDDTYVDYARSSAYRRLPLGLSLLYDLGRYRLEIDGESTHQAYDDQLTITGIAVSQDFRSGWESDLRARATMSFHPTLEIFVESAFGIDRYANETADTDRFSIAAGSTFEPHPLIRAEVLAGLGRQDFRIADGTSGLIFAGELTWYMSPLLTLVVEAERRFRGNVTTSSTGAFTTGPATTLDRRRNRCRRPSRHHTQPQFADPLRTHTDTARDPRDRTRERSINRDRRCQPQPDQCRRLITLLTRGYHATRTPLTDEPAKILPTGQHEELRRHDQVTPPCASRLLDQSIEPLETGSLHPYRRAPDSPRMKIERSTNTDHDRIRQQVRIGLHPVFLLG
jgi:hypothetical protein